MLVATMMTGALLWNGPIAELFISCDDECQDCDDGDRSCHCPSGCWCSPVPATIPPVATELSRPHFNDLESPCSSACAEPELDAPTRELLKVPKRVG